MPEKDAAAMDEALTFLLSKSSCGDGPDLPGLLDEQSRTVLRSTIGHCMTHAGTFKPREQHQFKIASFACWLADVFGDLGNILAGEAKLMKEWTDGLHNTIIEYFQIGATAKDRIQKD
eukprot:6304261-Pyramimonas_sp.AAC.1